MDAEFWGFVIALCTLGVLYFGGEIVREWHKEMRAAYRWGETPRRAPPEVHWACSHEFLACCVALLLFVFVWWMA